MGVEIKEKFPAFTKKYLVIKLIIKKFVVEKKVNELMKVKIPDKLGFM